MSARILVVDDDNGMRKSLAILLRRESYAVTEAPGGAEGADALGSGAFDLVIADLRMEGVSGLDILRLAKRARPDPEVILITAFGTVESAVEAMKLGAFDFITKPFQAEEILLRVRNAAEKRRLRAEVHELQAKVQSAFGLEGIVGVSEGLRRVLATVSKVAQTDSTVLLMGESGTGKDVVARAIHGCSRRGQGPFISISCAALPEQLLESELFGYAKGAFTGAVGARRGLLEESHGGSFFLDEVGEAPQSIQAKLLRVIEERSVRRLGDNRSIPVDVRIVAATNRDLEAAVRDKTFREDLFHRLNVVRIHLPPLRERREDIPLLARHFLALHCQKLGRTLAGLSPAALQALVGYDFPGNIRELSNAIEQAVALTDGPAIEPQDLPDALLRPAAGPGAAAGPVAEPKTLAASERERILERIRARRGNLGLVATDLAISRTTLWRRIKEYQITIRDAGTATDPS
jgi:two-component system response regulator HydG